mgnify:CR=1 FL=1
MNDEANQATQAKKLAAKRMRLSPVWLIPLGAVLIGAWLLFQNVTSRGPTVQLELNNAEGLEKGKTAVKVLNLDVGTVKDLRLTNDVSGVIAEISMQPSMEELLVEDTEFWVVKPRVGRQGISGLGTIISGAYIQMRPGESNKPAFRFRVLEQPPPTRPDVPGLTLELISQGDDTLSIGDPLVFKGQTVGQVETTEFDVDTLEVRYRIFIESPYDKLITKNTQFWLRSGIDVQLTSRGVEVQVGSLQAILAGGVTFGLPDGADAGPRATKNDKYVLHASSAAAQEDRFDKSLKYIVLFDDSVRGLNAGASVEFRGLRVGTVLEVPYFDEKINLENMQDFNIPVLISYEPERLGDAWENQTQEQWRERLSGLFKRGLRATVESASLLTGAMFVDLQFNEKAKYDGSVTIGKYEVFPSQPGGFATLEEKVTRILDKVNNLPIESLIGELEGTLQSTTKTLSQAERTLSSLNSILKDDAVRELPAELQSTMQEVRDTLNSFQNGNPAYDNLNRSLKKLNRVLEDLAPLAETLRSDPNALIFGEDQPADPVPKAAQ